MYMRESRWLLICRIEDRFIRSLQKGIISHQASVKCSALTFSSFSSVIGDRLVFLNDSHSAIFGAKSIQHRLLH